MMLAVIAVNVAAFLYELHHGVLLSTLDYGLIPDWLLHGRREGPIELPGVGTVVLHQEVPVLLTIFTSMFLHGGWLHLIGNMWFLWVFGDHVEGEMGGLRFVAFYLLCGIAAAIAQVAITPGATAPMVGASGAIAGVLGAYLRLHPHARVRCLWILIVFVTFVDLRAWILLGVWFLSQFFMPIDAGVAWMAHVGGFIAGFLVVPLFVRAPPAIHPPQQIGDWAHPPAP